MLFEGGKQTVVLYGGKLLQKGWKKSFYELLDKQSSNVVVVDRSVQPRPEWYWRDDTDPKKINNGKKERKKRGSIISSYYWGMWNERIVYVSWSKGR